MKIPGLNMVIVIAALLVGCKRPHAPSNPPALRDEKKTVLRVQWAGSESITPTNSSQLYVVSQLPETAVLQQETLNKLSGFILDTLNSKKDPTNTALLTSLLTAVGRSTWQIEAEQSNRSTNILAAINRKRANKDLLDLWLSAASIFSASNSANIVAPLFPIKTSSLTALEVRTEGDWLLLGMSAGTNSLMRESIARLKSGGAPLSWDSTNSLIYLEMSFPNFFSDSNLFCNALQIKNISWELGQTSESVKTKASIEINHHLESPLPPWKIPTSLVQDPLISFGCLRELNAFPSAIYLLSYSGLSKLPSQVFAWSQDGSPMLGFVAFESESPTETVETLVQTVTETLNPKFAEAGVGQFIRSTSGGLKWNGAPLLDPFISDGANRGAEKFVWAGLSPATSMRRPMPKELLQEVLSKSNTLYYHWELTQENLDSWLYKTQLLRVLFGKRQLPPNSASLRWLLKAEPLLGNCVTSVTLEDTGRLALTRESSVGFSAAELHLLLDWFQSPTFPIGLYSTSSHKETTTSKTSPPKTNR